MAHYIETSGLRIDARLYRLVEDEIALGTGIDPNSFWDALSKVVADLAPRNRALLDHRDRLQRRIDDWCRAQRGKAFDVGEYKAFLTQVGYLVSEREDFQICSANVDREISSISGPQLVVPLDNPRYVLNAANARWGSLYDALYGTDVVPESDGAEKGEGYNPRRGAKVIAYAEAFLDEAVGLAGGKFSEVAAYELKDVNGTKRLAVQLKDGREAGLADGRKFVGYREAAGELFEVIFRNNGLHIRVIIDRAHPIGKAHAAGVKDVVLEAAVTTIQDCEDSVAAVDAGDKVRVYRNWTSLMKGTLTASFEKGGREMQRCLNADISFTAPNGESRTLPGRSLMLVRNVGLHMYTDAVTTMAGEEIPEGFLDAMVTALAALHDLRRSGTVVNSRSGSVYIVKPKQHSAEEVAATVELFERVEAALGLKRNTLKIGIMDEERRLTVNLEQAIGAARERVVFINTGFLDRTGDEIHTSMELGPMAPKTAIKNYPWLGAYEDRNVDIGIATGLPGKAQIGKGMWTMPDEMRKMMDAKQAHPEAGANTAWVPSPTAATLHALHYHRVDVCKKQAALAQRRRADLDAILTPPLLDRALSSAEIQSELDNNAQGILGYVVRWVDQGIGCSKVPDIHDTALMEDRATLRISSQHIANWLHHGIVSRAQVIETFKRMAGIVDRQNCGDQNYRNMAPNFDQSIAFKAALDLVFTGWQSANGYTEAVLHTCRRQIKAASRGRTRT
ncbi:MAG: malate synthase G [Deltaproteobacteria bacterium]|nr:malate synthase G [Deltaproteobacteria bacterium]